MNIHFIAIGGAVMHNLAIALHKEGNRVSGSDDEIFEPSAGRLKKYGLLPAKFGWDESRISTELDLVILGMHARKDNPELIAAKKQGLPVFSFPEYIYSRTKNRKRVVIAGSHGKTTITSIILHALSASGIKFDYMVGSSIPGFETMVGFDPEAEIAVFEGDEYLTSPLDPRPKFAHYRPFITLISGIAWDHMNVYPDYADYKAQFLQLCRDTSPEGMVIYYENDHELVRIAGDKKIVAKTIPYCSPEYSIQGNKAIILHKNQKYPVNLVGKYNMENIRGAMLVCEQLGIGREEFLESMKNFKGSGRRQELVYESDGLKVFRDFAHAPSKVKATVEGFREFFRGEKIIAFLELHTFSSLNKDFLPQYRFSLDQADEATVYFSPEVVEHKKLPAIDPGFVKKCFSNDRIDIITNKEILKEKISSARQGKGIVLLMSSGNFGGVV